MKKSIIRLCMLLVSMGAMSLLVAKDIVPNSWINTRVTYDISVKELAERYYGDASEYKVILNANRGLIGKNLIVPKNTEIKIPITEKFTDQPEMLGWN